MKTEPSVTEKFPNRYRIEQQLGEGAAGVVYLATDLEQDCKVVLKALKKQAVSDARKVARFHNEFNALKNCIHQNVIRVFDFSEFKNTHFYTMEYLEGTTLDELIYEEDSTINIDTSINYLIQIAHGLDAVHQRGLIHRDLKPSNIFITKDNTVKLLDFGIARLTEANFNLTNENEMLGTPYYMSPEQNAREAVDHRSDIYSFGVMAFELLTKERPFKSESHFDLTLKHFAAEIPSAKEINPQIPSWLNSLITTCLQKTPDKRYDSIKEVAEYLHSKHNDIAESKGSSVSTLVGELGAKHNRNLAGDKLINIAKITKQFVATFALVTLFIALWSSPVGHFTNTTMLRTLFAIRGKTTPPDNIVLVALDDLTYQELSLSTRQPFPRKIWAQAITEVQKSHPTMLVLDGYIQKETHNEDENILLEKALKLGPAVLMKAEVGNDAFPKNERNSKNSIKYHSDKRFSDAVTREVPLLLQESSSVVAQISLKGIGTKDEERLPLLQVLRDAQIQDTATPRPQDMINFYGPPGTLPRIPMYQLFQNEYDFSNKIVFLGHQSYQKTDVPGAHDMFSTSGSFFEDYFGVEVHATIAANLIDGSYIKRLPAKIEILILSILLGVTFYSLISKRPSDAVKFYLIIISTWIGTTIFSFVSYNFLLPGGLLLLGASPIVFSIIWYLYATAVAKDLDDAESMTRIKFRKRTEQ